MTRAPLPSSSAVVAELRRAVGDVDHENADPLLALVLELHRGNLTQWELEDGTRGRGADDAAVAEAKRGIDRLNARRHVLMERIDATVDHAVTQAAGATPSTESPAMVFDRLSVLVLRIHHTELAARSDGSPTNPYAARLPILSEQLAVLEEALDALFAEIRAGTRRFVPYQHLKLYTS